MWRTLGGLEWCRCCATADGAADEALLAGWVAEEALVLAIMLAGGIATVLEFVSIVLPETTVALVDWIECESENVEDLTEEEHIENKGVILTVSGSGTSSRSAGSDLALTGSLSHRTFIDTESSSSLVSAGVRGLLDESLGCMILLTHPDSFFFRPWNVWSWLDMVLYSYT